MIKMRARFRSEPHPMQCPRCDVPMAWNSFQGPLGGWKCPECGLQIDFKG